MEDSGCPVPFLVTFLRDSRWTLGGRNKLSFGTYLPCAIHRRNGIVPKRSNRTARLETANHAFDRRIEVDKRLQISCQSHFHKDIACNLCYSILIVKLLLASENGINGDRETLICTIFQKRDFYDYHKC